MRYNGKAHGDGRWEHLWMGGSSKLLSVPLSPPHPPSLIIEHHKAIHTTATVLNFLTFPCFGEAPPLLHLTSNQLPRRSSILTSR
jgi:hypothetical protein